MKKVLNTHVISERDFIVIFFFLIEVYLLRNSLEYSRLFHLEDRKLLWLLLAYLFESMYLKR